MAAAAAAPLPLLPTPPTTLPPTPSARATPRRRSVVAEGLDTALAFARDVNERVMLRTRPDVLLKLRKRAPLVALDILVGTDLQLLATGPDGSLTLPNYTPNLQVEARDAFFGGDIRVRTKDNELSYTKNLDMNGAMRQRVTLGVSAVYNYQTCTPFAGFSVEATPGVSSSIGSNGLSINHSFKNRWLDGALRTRVDLMGSVTLPGTRFNSITRRVGLQGPVMIDLRAITVTAIV